MKRILLAAALAPVLCFAEENLVKDGKMDSSTGWSGDRKFETVDENRVLVMAAERSRSAKVSTEVNTRNLTDLVISFRYRSSGYDGRGLQLRCTRPDRSSTFRSIEIETDDQWHEYTWRFSEVRDAKSIEFSLELFKGTGAVMIDDVVIVSK